MKKFLFGFLLITSIISNAYSQPYAEGCDGIRYAFQIFNDVSKTTVKYATSTPENKDLFVDIYQPANDQVTKRPLIIFAHGGSFIAGDKSDMEPFCTFWSQRGFVTASLQYRLFAGFPTKAAMFDAAVKAVSDMKGAYRYFKSDAAKLNLYNIDTTKIFIGGLSAGAITALHAAYMDEGDAIASDALTTIIANGGFHGNTGDAENLSHNDRDIFGVFNMSGAVFTKGLLDTDEPFLMSFQGDNDDVVPIDSNSVFFGLAYLYGSRTIHKEADAIGLPNTLTVAPGGGHTDIYTSPTFAGDLAKYIYNSVTLFYPKLCGTSLSTKYTNRPALNVKAYPNPAENSLYVEADEKVDEVWLIDMRGEVVKRQKINDSVTEINTGELHSGNYILLPIKDNKAYKSLMFQIVR